MSLLKRRLDWPRRRPLLILLLLAPSLLMYIYVCYPGIRRVFAHSTAADSFKHLLDLPEPPANSTVTVNLVIASLAEDDIAWTAKLHRYIPNLKVIRYVSDSATAEFHPPVPKKGREATIYHTYLYDFYESLPDISIMIHAHENPWHMDGVLQQSMLFALSRLDLKLVRRRGYANLRVSWKDACPDWINTTKTREESVKQEEPFMREAWASNFGTEVPEILAGPCCSQFAVTREAIRSRGRDQYARSREWLLQSDWSDYIVGRTWEHMFPWLFIKEARDCPVEWRTYCAMYGVCFDQPETPATYNTLWKEREDLQESTEFWKEVVDPLAGHKARERSREIGEILTRDLLVALQRGKDSRIRSDAGEDLHRA